MDVLAQAVLRIILVILDIAKWMVIFSAILSWLFAFNIVNSRNQFVDAIGNFLYRITEPLYGPIRRVLPNLGGIDLSPLVVLLIIFFLQFLIEPYVYSVYRAGV